MSEIKWNDGIKWLHLEKERDEESKWFSNAFLRNCEEGDGFMKIGKSEEEAGSMMEMSSVLNNHTTSSSWYVSGSWISDFEA